VGRICHLFAGSPGLARSPVVQTSEISVVKESAADKVKNCIATGDIELVLRRCKSAPLTGLRLVMTLPTSVMGRLHTQRLIRYFLAKQEDCWLLKHVRLNVNNSAFDSPQCHM